MCNILVGKPGLEELVQILVEVLEVLVLELGRCLPLKKP
jgi:hypothetical protein